jgi:hypothetical protein
VPNTRAFAEAVAFAPDGTIVIAGTGTFGAKSGATMFVAGVDAKGATSWVRELAAADGSIGGVQVRPDGSVVVCGSFQKTLKLRGKTLATHAANDLFVLELDRAGAPRWVFAAAGPGSSACEALALEPDGKVAIAGSVSGAVQFGTLAPRDLGDADAIVAQLDATGHVEWISRAGSTESDDATAITVGDGAIYVAGSIGGPARFGDQPATFNARPPGAQPLAANPSNAFVARYAPTGELAWVHAFGAVDTFDRAHAIAALPDGVAIAGTVRDHAFVARYTADGRESWLREARTPSVSNAVIALPGARLLVADYWGWPQGGPAFDITGVARSIALRAVGSDTAVVEYSLDGELLGAGRLAGETPHHDLERGSELEMFAVARSPEGRIALVGSVFGSAIVDPGDVFRPTTARLVAGDASVEANAVVVLDPP